MDYLSKLENLLGMYIFEDKRRKERLDKCKDLKRLYKELIECLKCDYVTLNEEKLEVGKLFDSIYRNDIYLSEYYDILETINEDKESRLRFKKLFNDIYKDYNELLKEMESLRLQIERNKYMVVSANRVKLCFRHNLPINQNKYDIPNVKKIISYFEAAGMISNKEEILLINEIELYNRNLTITDGTNVERDYAYRIYSELPNILNAGFQLHDNIKIDDDRKETIEKFVKEILDYITYLDDDDIIRTIDKYRDYNLDMDEYKYIIIKLLDKCIDEINTYYQLLMDKDIYIKRGNRDEIIHGYYQVLDRYLILLKYYDEINRELTMDEIIESDIDEEEYHGSKVLVYLHSNVNLTRSKIITDMKNVPYEYYDKIYELLMAYKNDTISRNEIKKIDIRGLASYIELKDDQVRIVLKHIKDNMYAVMGVFAKKGNNDPVMYKTIVSRLLPDVSNNDKLHKELELSEIFETELKKLVSEKGRKGTR